LSGLPPGASDTLSLLVGNQTWEGWQRVFVTRSMDQMPASFRIQVTEKYPGSGADMDFPPGSPCQVMIGSDTVITGYIDRYQSILLGDNHTVTIFGRSKSEDLVDCAAFVPGNPEGFQILNATALTVAQTLAQPYNVTVTAQAQGNGLVLPQLNITPGETAWEVIDRMLRYNQLIAYDLTDGSVVLTNTTVAQSMASGFEQGVNVEQATVTFTMDQRFSVYEAHNVATALVLTQGSSDPGIMGTATDSGVPRFRKRIIISEQTQQGVSIAQQRAQWECNRRAARSTAITVRCDAWRDQAGTLWDLNHLAPVSVPACKCTPSDPWMIGTIVFQRDETGQHAFVTLMPKDAFNPEPAGDLTPWLLGNPNQNNPTATPNAPSGF
jgi:prophage tail gpP-like protein